MGKISENPKKGRLLKAFTRLFLITLGAIIAGFALNLF